MIYTESNCPENRGRLKSELSDLCLDVYGADTAPGAHLIQWPCHGGDNQRFTVPCGSCSGQLKAKHSQLCLQIENDSTGLGAHVIQRTCASFYSYWIPEQPAVANAFIYEPVGDSGIQAALNCGWHENCVDGVLQAGEKQIATDWQNTGGVNNNAWSRWWLTTNSSSAVNVGTLRIRNWDTECNSAAGELYDRWGYLVGRELFYHTDTTASAPYTTTAYAKSSGYQHSLFAGTYSAPDPLGCSTTGPHTHVWYKNLTAWERYLNGAIPTENTCNGFWCSVPRDAAIWSRWLTSFSFGR